MIISLTGFMGCGKSSIGRRLSELLCCPFMDLDEIIEARTGRSIPEIFATDGEDAFRKIEKSELHTHLSDHQRRFGRSLRSPHHCASLVVPPLSCRGWHGPHDPLSDQKDVNEVLALGGGTVMTKECADMVHEMTICIYLRATVDTLAANLNGETEGRPMLKSEDGLEARIKELMSMRAETYERTAHIIIDTDGKSIEEIAEAVRTALMKQ